MTHRRRSRFRLSLLPVLSCVLLLAGGCSSGRFAARNSYAIECAERQLWTEAAYHWQRLLDEAPTDYRLHNNLAVAALAQGDYPLAKEHFRASLALRPAQPDVQRNLDTLTRFLEAEYTIKPGTATPAAGPLYEPAYPTPEPESQP